MKPSVAPGAWRAGRKAVRSAAPSSRNDSADPSVSVTVWLTPARTNVTATREPGGWDLTASSSAVALPIGWPANRTITSPGCSPARAAGPPGVTGRAPSCALAICAPFPM